MMRTRFATILAMAACALVLAACSGDPSAAPRVAIGSSVGGGGLFGPSAFNISTDGRDLILPSSKSMP